MDDEEGERTRNLELEYSKLQDAFKMSRDVRGTYLDQAINIERQADEVLCDLFRIDFEHRPMFRETLLGAPPLFKYDALRVMLDELDLRDGRFRKLGQRLKEMNDIRVRYAHSWVVLGPLDEHGERDFFFRRYKDGTEKETKVTRAEMEAQLEKQEVLYTDLLRVSTAILQHRAGTRYWNEVDSSGTSQAWGIDDVASD